MGFPFSRVIVSASSSARASTASLHRKRKVPRSFPVRFRQEEKASLACAMAWRARSRPPVGTVPTVSPVAGFKTSRSPVTRAASCEGFL